MSSPAQAFHDRVMAAVVALESIENQCIARGAKETAGAYLNPLHALLSELIVRGECLPEPEPPEQISVFARLVAGELARARKMHEHIHRPHEGYAVIKEQLDQFWDLLRQKHHPADRQLHELIQIAAMAQRTAEDAFPEKLIAALLSFQEAT